jgi:deoxyribodipyrimidine photo-lyase
LETINRELRPVNSGLKTFYCTPKAAFEALCSVYTIENVFTNHDYEPYAIARDGQISAFLVEKGIKFQSFKDQVIFEKAEVTKDDGLPYTVFTPYSKKWKSKLTPDDLKSHETEPFFGNFLKQNEIKDLPEQIITLEEMGFSAVSETFPSSTADMDIIAQYHETRDFPAISGTTRLGMHLRFGTISIRQLAQKSLKHEKYLNELIWREFYQQILWHFPHVVGNSFRPQYDKIVWRNNEKEFQAWCEGKTGYPIVDAGMRELNTTGWMHNRVRMIVASFLTKHLLIDWRWGEAYFAEKLLDFDLASNNGGWQWAAGSGVDAAPYFRIFSPKLQTQKFDPKGEYIAKWVPELKEFGYPNPIVEHDFARKRCLEVYKKALSND